MRETIIEAGINAPIFISIASLCEVKNAKYPSRIAEAQHELIDEETSCWV